MKSFSQNFIHRAGLIALVMGAIGALASLIWLSKFNAALPSATSLADQQRLKALADIHAMGSPVLDTYASQNPDKGIIRIPIDLAMELTATEWTNPAAARSNLLSRAAVALEVPPSPETVTNQYE